MEKHLIKDTERLQKFVRINISVLRESFLPYEFDAQHKYIRPYLSDQLTDELISLEHEGTFPAWANSQGKENLLSNILYHTQNCLAKFTIYLAAPHMDLHLSEMGFVVTNTQHSAPASSQRVKAARDAMLSQGYDNLEILLQILEKNHKTIQSYGENELFVLENNNIISNTAEFDNILPISRSRLRFISLRPEMTTLKKFFIIPGIGQEMFQELLTQKQNLELSPDNHKLIKLLQYALAYKSIANTLNESNALRTISPMLTSEESLSVSVLQNTRIRYETYAKAYLMSAKRLLLSSPGNYPAYKNSSQYDFDVLNKPYENQESGLFVCGQPNID